MVNIQRHLDDLDDRMDAAVLLLDATHPLSGSGQLPGPASREARGLVIVMLFAAYENLLRSLTRTVLEGAIQCRVSTKRLKPGIMRFALANSTRSARDRSVKKLYAESLPQLIEAFHSDRWNCLIDSNAFPDDGSFMKSSQVRLWCQVFDIASPPVALRAIWTSLDAVVAQRNAVAHGSKTPSEVGRMYTETEMRALVDDWRKAWTDFLKDIGARASSRDFFRTQR